MDRNSERKRGTPVDETQYYWTTSSQASCKDDRKQIDYTPGEIWAYFIALLTDLEVSTTKGANDNLVRK